MKKNVIMPKYYFDKEIESIDSNALQGCSSLTSIVIPNSVTSIGDYAFDRCSSLTSIEIPNSVTCIGMAAFEYCTSLTSIEIPNSVINIGTHTFYGCSSLASVKFEDESKLTSIERYTFARCSSLTSIVIPNSVTSFDSDNVFDYCNSLTIYCEASSQPSGWRSGWNNGRPIYFGVTQEEIIYQEGLQYLIINGEAVVTGHEVNITNIVIPNNIEVNGLTYSVTSIVGHAFYRCSSLTSIVIPNSATSIGDLTFSECSSLSIYCEASSKPSGWSSSWNYSNRYVCWGYINER